MTPSFRGRMAWMWLGVRPAILDVDGHHRGLVQDDAPAADVDQGVGGTEIDRHVTAEKRKTVVAHQRCTPPSVVGRDFASACDHTWAPLHSCFAASGIWPLRLRESAGGHKVAPPPAWRRGGPHQL